MLTSLITNETRGSNMIICYNSFITATQESNCYLAGGYTDRSLRYCRKFVYPFLNSFDNQYSISSNTIFLIFIFQITDTDTVILTEYLVATTGWALSSVPTIMRTMHPADRQVLQPSERTATVTTPVRWICAAYSSTFCPTLLDRS